MHSNIYTLTVRRHPQHMGLRNQSVFYYQHIKIWEGNFEKKTSFLWDPHKLMEPTKIQYIERTSIILTSMKTFHLCADEAENTTSLSLSCTYPNTNRLNINHPILFISILKSLLSSGATLSYIIQCTSCYLVFNTYSWWQ